MSEWEERQLGDCVQMWSGGTPSKANNAYWNGDIPWVSAKDMKSFFLHDTQDHLTQEGAENGTKIAPKNSILILVRGMTLHNDLPIGCPTRDMAFNQDVKAIIADKTLIESRYLAYWLLANKPQLMGLVESASHGTGRINTDDLKSIIILCPDLEEQKQISDLLENFDRKIENLRRQNETLERIAQTLFKHWFVDFEFPNEDGKPYKSSGGEMVRSELGEIPAGWRVGKLGDVTATITKGTTPTTLKKQFQNSGINFVKAESITDDHSIDSSKLAYIDEKTNQLLKRSILQVKDVVYTIAGTIGRYAIVNESLLPANTNQAVAIIRPNTEKVDPEYLLCYFSSRSYQHYLSSRVVQAVQANLSLGILSESPIILPDKNTKMNFGNLAKPLFQKKEENQKQIQSLTKTRDVLLPQLMSGKLRITE